MQFELEKLLGKDLMESITEAGITAKTLEDLTEGLQNIVEAKVEAEVENRLSEEREAHAEEITNLEEQANEYGLFLQEKAEEYGEHIKNTISENAEVYLDQTIQEFVSEHREAFTKLDKFERINEAYAAMTTAIADLGLAISGPEELAEKKFDELNRIHENTLKQLKDARDTARLLENRLTAVELTAGLTDFQKDKINESVESLIAGCSSSEEVKTKLESLVESVSSSKEEKKTNKQNLLESTDSAFAERLRKLNERLI